MFFNKCAKLLKATEEQLLVTQNEVLRFKKELENANSLLNETNSKLQKCEESNLTLNSKYAKIIDIDKTLQEKLIEIEKSEKKLIELNQKYQSALQIHTNLEKEINIFQDSLEIGSFGLYKPQFGFETSEKYKQAIDENYNTQKDLINNDQAVICHTEWEVGGSKSEGRKMTNKYKKLMLFAFNGECDSCIAKVKWNNVEKSKDRIRKAYSNINKLGESYNISISGIYLQQKLKELSLTHEYEQKKYEEKENQRLIKEQMREEEKAQKELEKAQKEAAEEEERFEKALEKARKELNNSKSENVDILKEQINLLEKQLHEAHERKERAISMAQQTKVGHIYIISNIGSFGENIYKIGMTRRLEPLDRVRELGDASVPFHFDIHAVIYSENAPQLEYELHKRFLDRRLNRVNNRKEFFNVSLEEIEEFVKKHTNAEIEFSKIAEAREYRETLTILEQSKKSSEKDDSLESHFPKSLI